MSVFKQTEQTQE